MTFRVTQGHRSMDNVRFSISAPI